MTYLNVSRELFVFSASLHLSHDGGVVLAEGGHPGGVAAVNVQVQENVGVQIVGERAGQVLKVATAKNNISFSFMSL